MTATILTSQILSKILSGTPVIYNLELTDANTEYSQALPANTVKYALQCRSADDIKLSFTAGESGSKYITVHSGKSFSDVIVSGSPPTLYLQAETAGVVVEVVAWIQ